MSTSSTVSSLSSLAATCCKPLDIGVAVLPEFLEGKLEDASYKLQVKDEFNSVVVEHHLKWTSLCEENPGPLYPNDDHSVFVKNKKQAGAGDGAGDGDGDGDGDGGTGSSAGGVLEYASRREGRYDFRQADRVVDWAITNKKKVKGHCLIWHGKKWGKLFFFKYTVCCK